MAVLLTGGTGFIGSHVLQALLEQNRQSVVVLKRSFSNLSRIQPLLSHPGLVLYDIDKVSLEKVFQENAIETIIHIATEYGRTPDCELKVLEANVLFPLRLLQQGLPYGLKYFINTDSYFNKPGLAYNYLAQYSLSKQTLLQWLKFYTERVKVFNVILEHPFGAFDGREKFTEQMIQKIAIEQVPSVNLTQGLQQRDFIYVRDVAQAYIKTLEYASVCPDPFTVLEVGTGKALAIKEFVETIKQVSHSSTVLNFGALPSREGEIQYSAADNHVLKAIGWRPQYRLEDALREVIQVYKVAVH